MVKTFSDITQERQIDIAKSEFVSMAAHQLRTPLSSIGWYTELLLSDEIENLSLSQLKYLNQIDQSKKRM